MRSVEDDHTDRDDQERHQRADARHLGQELDRQQPGSSPTTTATTIVLFTGRPRPRVHCVEQRRQQPVPADGEQDAGLPVDRHQVTLKIEMTAPAASTLPGQSAPVTFCRIPRARLLTLELRSRLAPTATTATAT